MRFKDDYSFITGKAGKMIEMGFADLDLHSIRIDTYISDEQNEKNIELLKELTNEEWDISCKEFKESQNKKVEKILDILAKHFKIYQYKDASIEYHNNNSYAQQNGYEWDLYCNFDGRRDARLSFNNLGKSLEQRYEDLKKIKELLETYEDDGIKVDVQYTQSFHMDELKVKAIDTYNHLKDKFINYNGMIGKIKKVEEYNDSYYGTTCMFGFFKKGSKKKYYHLTNMDIVIM